MEKLTTSIVLKVGQYLSLDGQYVIWEGERIGEIKESLPKDRKLKAVVTKKTEDGYELKVLRFADIHRHSGYSLLDGASKIEEIVERTDYVGALTDHGNMFGYLKYYKAMNKAGKQPILGFEAYSETIHGVKDTNHLLLLAKNYQGFKNLTKLTSLAYNNFYRKPHVSYEMLKKHKEGIIVTSACIGGEIPQAILAGNMEEARTVAKWFKAEFGDDFYLEIQSHNMGEEEDIANRGLIELSKELDIKLVATTDSHYTLEEDKGTHEILLCLQTKKTLDDENRMRFPGSGYHIHTVQEMEDKFKFIPDALDNTLEIAEKCSGLDLNLGKLYLPEFKVPEGFDTHSHFKHEVWKGFHKRFDGTPMETDETYLERLNYEIEIIAKMGYEAYFLIVADFINYAKTNNIMVGPGRGSAVGSLVSYALGIVDLDPIPYGLLFERFLNPERVSMPDIDVDFDDEERVKVIEYVRQKYGEDAVSKIITFGTMGAKSVVRDVARTKGYDYSVGDRIAKQIPAIPGMTLDKAMADNPDLRNMYDEDHIAREIIDISKRLEGLPRHASVHACGVVIAASDVSNYLPVLMMGDEGGEKELTAQVTMTEVEDMGLLKMDFLGLRTMTVIGKSITSINANEKINLEYLKIPLDDPYVYSDIAKGKTYGVFQLEGGGMRKFMTELYSDVDDRIRAIEKKFGKKGFRHGEGREDFMIEMQKFGNELFERLIAGVSLYRPGPMEYIPNYINGMLNPDEIRYLTPSLEPILYATYGTIVYQEQVMKIVQELGGYSLARADLVRRAMGKKKADVMEQEKKYFVYGKVDEETGEIEVEGCIMRGISEAVALEIWAQMEDFSKYAFNKSHAAAYAVIAVKTAWLKHYYPVDFMASTLNSIITDSQKLKSYLSVCKEMDIEILQPNVNLSNEKFSRSGKDIVFGLKGIRNVGSAAHLIVEERVERGPFRDLRDFVVRMTKFQRSNKGVLEGLAYAGAMDAFGHTRKSVISIIPVLLTSAAIEKKAFSQGQLSLFDIEPEVTQGFNMDIPDYPEFPKKEKLSKEKEYAGFYVTEHPLDAFSKYFKNGNVTEIGLLTLSDDEDDEDAVPMAGESLDGKPVRLAGIIEDLKIFYTKKDNKPLYAFRLEGRSGEIEAVMFSNNIEANRSKLAEGKIVIVSGKLKADDRGLRLIADSMEDIETIEKEKSKPKYLLVNLKSDEDMNAFRNEVLNNKMYKGNLPVYVKVDGKTYKAKQTVGISLSLRSVLDNHYDYSLIS